VSVTIKTVANSTGQVAQWFRGTQTPGNNSQPSQGIPITNIGGTAMTHLTAIQLLKDRY